MTATDISIPLGFTTHGRPMILDRSLLSGPVFPVPAGAEVESATLTFDDLPTILGGIVPRETPGGIANVTDRYQLVGADREAIANNLKSYAFARSAALRWSRDLGEPVAIYKHLDSGDLGAGVSFEYLEAEEVIEAHAMSAEEFAEESLATEQARLENVVANLREAEMDIRATREDAEAALDNLKAVAALNDVPNAPVAEAMRAAAEAYEVLAWYALIDDDDEDMIGKLSAEG